MSKIMVAYEGGNQGKFPSLAFAFPRICWELNCSGILVIKILQVLVLI